MEGDGSIEGLEILEFLSLEQESGEIVSGGNE
jgi:hypothetical protein